MSVEIPESFKVEWLNKTLEFVKNDSKKLIKYPKMPSNYADYLHNLVLHRNNGFVLGKSIYAPLWEAMRIYSLQYTFTVSMKSEKDGARQLILEKLPKIVHIKSEENNIKKKSEIELPNVIKHLIKKKKLIDKNSGSFLVKSLKAMLNFINDEAMASLVFQNLEPTEAKFLQNFLGIYNRRHNLDDLLSQESKDILNEISISFKQFGKSSKLEIGGVIKDKTTKRRQVTFLKVPKYSKPTTGKAKVKAINNSVTKSNESVERICKFMNALDLKEEDGAQKIEDINSLTVTVKIRDAVNVTGKEKKVATCSTDEQSTESKDTILEQNEKLNKVKSDTVQKKKNDIDTKSDKVQKKKSDLDNKSVKKTTVKEPIDLREIFLKDPKDVKKPSSKLDKSFNKSTHGISHNDFIHNTAHSTKLCARKTKLLEDMSVPLESDKGMRMMRLMGWEGGALGLRGEGITEPIIPELTLAPGAGLGHVSMRLDRKQAHVDNNLDILKTILNLVQQDIESCKKIFDRDINKDDKKFIKRALVKFNGRSMFVIPQDEARAIGSKILDEMVKKADIKIKADFSNKRDVTFTKIQRDTSKKGKKKKIKQISDETLYLPEIKTVYKQILLEKILEFVKSDYKTINIDFEDFLTSKQCEFLERACNSINERKLITESKMTMSLSEQIIKAIGQKYIFVNFYPDLLAISLIRRKKLAKNIEKEATKDETGDKSNSKENDVTKNNCDINLENDINTQKEIKTYVIVITDTRNMESSVFLRTIQDLIINKCNDSFVPTLKCHGVVKRAVIYSCHNKKSYLWLKEVLHDFQVTDYKDISNKYLFEIIVNTVVNAKIVLGLLEKTNTNLCCQKWEVLEEKCEDSLMLLVEVDFESFNLICDSNFKVNTGVDEAHFSLRI